MKITRQKAEKSVRERHAPRSHAAPTAAGALAAAAPLLPRFLTYMYSPFLVWMVAPVVMPGSNPGLGARSYSLSSTASATTASIKANWSPTHLRGPPLQQGERDGGQAWVGCRPLAEAAKRQSPCSQVPSRATQCRQATRLAYPEPLQEQHSTAQRCKASRPALHCPVQL